MIVEFNIDISSPDRKLTHFVFYLDLTHIPRVGDHIRLFIGCPLIEVVQVVSNIFYNDITVTTTTLKLPYSQAFDHVMDYINNRFATLHQEEVAQKKKEARRKRIPMRRVFPKNSR